MTKPARNTSPRKSIRPRKAEDTKPLQRLGEIDGSYSKYVGSVSDGQVSFVLALEIRLHVYYDRESDAVY